MINLLLGEYGCGKSTHIYESIGKDYENGVSSFLIVPEQYALECEKRIATILPPSAQLSCEVLNFTRLANKVFREYGGLKYNYITNSAKNLIMYLAISQVRDKLKEYKITKGHEKSCISMFLQAIFELKSYNVTPSGLEKAKERLENTALQNKLDDILTVWACYEGILKARFSDPLDDIYMLNNKLEGLNYFKGYNVYIDSFYGFTKGQLDVISHIIRDAKNVTLAFDCPCDISKAHMQYAKVIKSIKDIMRLCEKQNKKYKSWHFDTDYKHISNDIKHICKNIWSFSCGKEICKNDVSLVLCGDEFEESELVASKIKELLIKGYKYGEIAIIARNADTYRGILDYTLKKFHIPYFYSTPSDLLGMPVIKMVFNALNAISGYKAEDIIAYTKCGYTDLDNMSASMLEEYMVRWGIYGNRFLNDDYWSANPDGYVDSQTERQEKRLKLVLEARNEVINKLSILAKPFLSDATVRECAAALYEFLKSHNIVAKLENEKRGADKEGAYLIAQVYNALLEALDTVVDICGDNRVNPATFSTLLHYAFIDAELGSIPTGEDTVLIADASLVRATSIKHVFLIGVNEGVFPASVKESSFFTDNDKLLLEDVDIILSEMTDMRSDDELMIFKNSIAIASCGATISALSSSIMGEAKQPSVGFTRIKDLFEGLEEEYSSRNIIDKIYTPELALEYYSASDKDLKNAISQRLGVSITGGSFSNDRQVLSEGTLNTIYTGDLRLTQSAIEKFQSCHFSYYAYYLLKLRSNRKFEFASIEIGNMFHSVFEYILTIIRDLKGDFSGLTDDEVGKLVSQLSKEYIENICKGAFISGRLNHLFTKMEANLQVVTKKIVDEFRQSGFSPSYFELNFDGDGKNEPLPLELTANDGTKIILHGKADRVDVYRNEGYTYVRIVDYKTGNKEFNMADFKNGTELQLFIYLFALCKMKDCKFKQGLLMGTSEVLPAGAYYMPLKVGKTVVERDLPLNADEVRKISNDEIRKNAMPNGVFLDDENILKIQDKSGEFFPKKTGSSKKYFTLEGFEGLYNDMEGTIKDIVCSMKNGDASAIPLKDDAFFSTCDFCENKAFCRRRK